MRTWRTSTSTWRWRPKPKALGGGAPAPSVQLWPDNALNRANRGVLPCPAWRAGRTPSARRHVLTHKKKRAYRCSVGREEGSAALRGRSVPLLIPVHPCPFGISYVANRFQTPTGTV
jgi:hypothetical protein